MEDNKSFTVLPPHNNKMVWSILCTIFCCLVGGIAAIIYSSKSNSLYNAALISSDDSLRQSLYYQSEDKNKTAQTWITVSIICGIIAFLIQIIFGVGFLHSMIISTEGMLQHLIRKFP